jgi:hypothetical protein
MQETLKVIDMLYKLTLIAFLIVVAFLLHGIKEELSHNNQRFPAVGEIRQKPELRETIPVMTVRGGSVSVDGSVSLDSSIECSR